MANWKKVLKRKRFSEYGSFASKRLEKSRKILFFAKIAFLSLFGLFIIFIISIPLFAFNLPSPDKVVRREGFSTKILDRNGEVLYDIYENQRRTPVSLGDIPLYLRQATVAVEDKNFYKHQGFDITGYLRAIYNIVVRRKLQGGSTLTQQLVKNTLLTSERTIFRKIREFILAVQIERKYTKDEILQMYLNEAPYGGTAWGVEAASELYFGKSVKDLNLVESAILAGLPQRPSVYSPYSSTPKAYIDRTKAVLRRMREDGYITKEQEEEALSQLDKVEFKQKEVGFKAPHFVQYVQKILEEKYGEDVVTRGGLKVTTTLDLKLQEKAQSVVSEEIAKVEKLNITNGAAVVLDPETGEILAMVGSKNFSDPNYDGQVNVTLSLRQPGSAIKPITYAAGLKKGYTASTLLMDVPTEFGTGQGGKPYKPVNYDGKYRGPVQVRYALGNSLNIPAVKMLALVGIENTLRLAYDLGINSLEPTKDTLSKVGLSLALGGGEVRLLELTAAYSSFANQGYRVDPIAILKVEDLNGKVLEQTKPQKSKSVLSPQVAYIIANILSDNDARKDVFGPNSLLNIPGRTVMVKTGTTNDKRDNWAIGGNTQVMVGVWVGNNDNSEMKQVASGISGASPIWRRIILESLSGKPNIGFERPSDIETVDVDVVSGYRAHDGFPSRPEIFVKGTEPGDDPVHVKLKVCKNDGKIATPADISSGNYEEREYFIFKEEDPTSSAVNKWQEGILNWISTQSDPRYRPPTEYCGATNPLNVDFDNPRDRDSNLPSSFEVKLRADSTSDIKQVSLYIDGNLFRSFNKPPYTVGVSLDKGVHKLKVVGKDADNHQSEREITVGVLVNWDYVPPSPTPLSTPLPTNTPSPTPFP
jgi:1A family penicillin-binding protein